MSTTFPSRCFVFGRTIIKFPREPTPFLEGALSAVDLDNTDFK